MLNHVELLRVLESEIVHFMTTIKKASVFMAVALLNICIKKPLLSR